MDLPNLDLSFNSSDGLEDPAEDWRQQFEPNPNYGKRIATSIIANQAEERTLTKRNARNLTYMKGAPSSRQQLTAVATTWDTFYTALKKDATICPTGEDIFRYVDTMTRQVKPHIAGKPVPSLSTIHSIWRCLIELLTFRHRELLSNYNKTDVMRIQTHLDQLVKRNLLFKGLWYEKVWLGFRIIQAMARTWLEKSLADGCGSWDKVLLKLLSVVLMSAFASRSGDVLQTAGYKEPVAMCWKDAKLVLGTVRDGLPSVQDLSGTFTLRFTKGQKDLNNKDEVRFIDPLDEQSQNMVCLVKLLMVVSLRFGHAQGGNSLKEVLEHTAKRRDRTVQWTRPTWPIICQMPLGKLLPLQEPGGAHIANQSIKNLALVGGIIGRVSSHAIRHGAIRDTAYIKRQIRGVATSAVSAAVGHTDQARLSGVTRGYVGPLQETIYNIRAADPLRDRRAPTVAESPVDLRRNQPGEIDKYMDDNDMERTDLKLRRTAADRLRKDRINEWEKQAEDRAAYVHGTPNVAMWTRNVLPGTGKVIFAAGTTNVGSTPDNNVTADVASPKLPSENRLEAALISTKDIGMALSEQRKSSINVSQGRIYADREARKEREYLIDPYLLALDQNPDEIVDEVDEHEYKALTQMLFPSQEDNASNTNEALEAVGYANAVVESHLIEIMQSSQDTSDPLTLEPDDFVRFFSSINTFKSAGNVHDKVRATAALLEGNSRDKPTRFKFYCGIGECLSDFTTAKLLNIHQVNCKGVNKEAIVRPFQCPTCQKSYLTEESLAYHQQRDHKFQSRPCYMLECRDKGIIFQTPQELINHQKLVHSVLDPPLPCPLKEEPHCRKKEDVFTNRNTFKDHLTVVHKQTREQIAAFIPSAANSRDLSCPLKCSTNFYAKGFWDVRKHLKNAHQKSDEECLEILPLTPKEVAVQVKRSQSETTQDGKCPIGGCQSKDHVFASAGKIRAHLKNTHRCSEEKIAELVPHQRRQRKKAKLVNTAIDEEEEADE